MKKYDVVIPIAEKDVEVLMRNFTYFSAFLPMKQLVIIGSQKVQGALQQIKNSEIEIKFVDEDSILSFGEVKKELQMLSDGNVNAEKRTGWYLQQFLKMMYAYYCDDKYYLVWDADTIPLCAVEMEQNGRAIFHMKSEYHPPYFDTMKKLIPNLSKKVDKSFIAEHMLFSTEIMKNMIDDIEKHEQHIGLKFWQVVLRCVEKSMLPESGFSEFETYGNYCMLKYPEEYVLQEWNAFRAGGVFFDRNTFSAKDAKWVSQGYVTISFEKTAENKKVWEYRLYKNKVVQKLFKFSFLFRISSGIRRRKGKILKMIRRK